MPAYPVFTAGGTPTYPVSFSRRGRLRTRTSIAGSMLLGYFFATLSLLLHYFFTTPSLLLHYSFTTLSLLLDLRSSFAQPSPDLRSSFAHPPTAPPCCGPSYIKKRRPRVAYPQIEAFALPLRSNKQQEAYADMAT